MRLPAHPPVHDRGAPLQLTPRDGSHGRRLVPPAANCPLPFGRGGVAPSPSFLSHWPGPDGTPSRRLTVDIQHDVPAVLTHRAHGHARVAARVRGPGSGQGEDPAPREDLRPQKEAHVSLCTSGGSSHTFTRWPQQAPDPRTPHSAGEPGAGPRPRDCCQQVGKCHQCSKSPLEQGYSY